MIEREIVDDILKHADIVNVISSYINVIKRGRSYEAICPFHDDKNPSLKISKEKQIYKCFVCNEGGNAIRFIQKYEQIGFEDAVLKLAEIIGYENKDLKKNQDSKVNNEKQPYFSALNDLTEFYMMTLSAKEGEAGREYLTKRHLDDEIIKNFSIGYCPSNGNASIAYLQASGHSVKIIEELGIAGHNGTNYYDKNSGRVVFSLKDGNGQVIGYSARDISGTSDAKYVNSPESIVFHKGNNLYNYDNAKRVSRLSGYVYIVEGFMDAIALHRIGIQSVVAGMGTALTNTQVELLRRLNVEVRLCYDGDNAGQAATLKNIGLLDKANINYRIVKKETNYPKDCDEILKKLGEDKLRAYLENLVDKSYFVFEYYKNSNSLITIDDRKKFIKDILPLVINITSVLELEDYILNIARVSKFDVKIIRQIVEKARSNAKIANNKDENDEFIDFDKLMQKRELNRLLIAERAMVYHMLTDKKAIEFYEKNNVMFSDEIYRRVVAYVVECYKQHDEVQLNELLLDIQMSGDSKEAELNSTISQIILEKTKYPCCDDEALHWLKNTIDEERQKQYDEFIYKESIKGKSDEEKIRLMIERNKKLGEKLYKKKKE